MDAAVLPLVAELRRRGIDYRGVLYAGLMLTAEGPKVIEYNVRFGDPEAQVVLPLLSSDPAELFLAVGLGRLDPSRPPAGTGEAAVCVVLASQGYPERPRTGNRIEGLDPDGPVGGRGRRSDRLPCRHRPPRGERALLHRRGTCARGHRGGPVADRGAPARLRRRGTDRMGGNADAPRHRGPGGRWDPRRSDRSPVHLRGRGDRERAVIPRYAPADMAALFSDDRPLRDVARGRAAGDRGPGRRGGCAASGRGHAAGPRRPWSTTCSSPTVLEREKVTDHDVAAFVDVVQERIGAPAGSQIHYGLTSSDVVDTALCATLDPGRRPAARRPRRLRRRAEGAGPPADGRPGDRAHPRHARRADDLRRQVRALGPAGRPRPAAACAPPAPPSPSASSRARWGRTPTSSPRSKPGCAPRWASPRSRHPGHRPRPPRRVPLRVRVRRHARSS